MYLCTLFLIKEKGKHQSIPFPKSWKVYSSVPQPFLSLSLSNGWERKRDEGKDTPKSIVQWIDMYRKATPKRVKHKQNQRTHTTRERHKKRDSKTSLLCVCFHACVCCMVVFFLRFGFALWIASQKQRGNWEIKNKKEIKRICVKHILFFFFCFAFLFQISISTTSDEEYKELHKFARDRSFFTAI